MSSRAAYEAKAEADFAAIQSQLAAIAARAKKAVAATQAKGERLITAAQSKHDEALHRFELLKRASEESWHTFKTTFEIAWAELRHALGQKE